MKRPLLTAGFTFLISLTILTYIDSLSFSLAIIIISYVLLCVGMLIKRCRKSLFVPAVCLSVCISSFLFFNVQKDYLTLKNSAGLKKEIVAIVEQEPKYYEEYKRYYCTCELVSLNDIKVKGNIRLSFSGDYENIDPEDFVIGNVISFEGQLYKVGGNIEGIADYYKSLKVYIGANNIKKLTVTSHGKKPLTKLGNDVRNKISLSLNRYFSSDTAGVLTALITGNKDSLSDEIYGYFKLIGIAHLMAVSGMHLSILSMLAEFLLKKLRHKKLKSAILSLFVFLIMFLANFSPSVMRAGTMHLMHLVADTKNKRSDSLNSLGLSLIIILSINPFACKSTGLLLSVMSTLAILIVSLPMSEVLSTRLGDVLNIRSIRLFSLHKAIVFSLVTSFSVMVFTIPILVDIFGSFSLMSPIANLAFLPLSPVLIATSAIASLLSVIGFMPSLLSNAIEGFTRLCILIAKVLSQFDILTVNIESKAGVLICFIVCVLIVVFGALVQKRIIKKRRNNY